MRRCVVVLLLVVAVAGCGGGKSADIRHVERVFAEHGQPFQAEVLANPDLRPREPLWTFRNRNKIEPHVRGYLFAANPTTFSALQVWVFDSAASARAAQRLTPGFADRKARHTANGDSTSDSGFVVRQGNLIVTGSGNRWPAVRDALADLR